MNKPPDSPADSSAAAEGRARILVVDDLSENLLVYQTILEDFGQEIVLAHSGEQALKEILKQDFARSDRRIEHSVTYSVTEA